MGKNKRVKAKSAKKVNPSQPKISCFANLSASKASNLKSPEYTMSGVKTRHRSKKSQPENQPEGTDISETSDTDSSVLSEEEATIHSGVLPCPEVISEEKFESLGEENKISTLLKMVNSLCSKVTEIDVVLNHDTDGLMTKSNTLQTQCDENTTKVKKIPSIVKDVSNLQAVAVKVDEHEGAIAQIKEDTVIIKGLLVKQSAKLASLNEKVAMLTARSKEKNITITNLLGDIKGESCIDTVVDFFRAELEIDVMNEEILVAHRVGKPEMDKEKAKKSSRVMLVRVVPELKKRIFENVSNLKNKKNKRDQLYYINKQLPDMFIEQKRQNKETIAEIKKKREISSSGTEVNN